MSEDQGSMSDQAEEQPTQDAEPRADEGAAAETAGAAAADSSPEAGPAASQAWDDVLSEVNRLGDAISNWARTAAEDPENRRKLDEIQAGMDDMARQAQDTFEDMEGTDWGKQVRGGLEETGRVVGGAAQRVSDAAAPHVALIFAGLADAFGKAAAGVDESARRRAEETAARPEEPTATGDEAGGDDADLSAKDDTDAPAKDDADAPAKDDADQG